MSDSLEFEATVRDWLTVYMRRSMQEFQRWSRSSGLSPSHLNTLMGLYHAGSCRTADIVGHIGLSPAAASQIADRLTSLGLVERTEDAVDRRVKRLALTEKGRAWVEAGLQAKMAWLVALAQRIPPGDQELVRRGLACLTKAAKASDEASPSVASEASTANSAALRKG
jgi:DNA-binding MarR family transcriptional regulator